jgi:sterol desaturase/sphingolipid hydroxylase (fatty acid hydroxylase superfamily)
LVLFTVIYLLAVPPLAVAIFVLFGTIITFTSHANLRVPRQIDRMLRWVIVTPSVHVIHHSALREETDSNYGIVFSVWDRLFGTYRERPRGDGKAVISMQGLEVFREPRDARLDRVLWHPFAYRTHHRRTSSVVANV